MVTRLPAHSTAAGSALVRRIREHWLIVAAGILGVAVGSGLQIVTNIKGLFAPDAMEVATEQSKEAISRDFVKTSWRRLYRSRVFIARLKRAAPEAQIDAAWTSLLESVEDMASKTMIYTIMFSKFYDLSRRDEYETIIQPRFVDLTVNITDIYYRIRQEKIVIETVACEIGDIERELDLLNVELYRFVSCFDEKNTADQLCRGLQKKPPRSNPPREC